MWPRGRRENDDFNLRCRRDGIVIGAPLPDSPQIAHQPQLRIEPQRQPLQPPRYIRAACHPNLHGGIPQHNQLIFRARFNDEMEWSPLQEPVGIDHVHRERPLFTCRSCANSVDMTEPFMIFPRDHAICPAHGLRTLYVNVLHNRSFWVCAYGENGPINQYCTQREVPWALGAREAIRDLGTVLVDDAPATPELPPAAVRAVAPVAVAADPPPAPVAPNSS